MKKKEIEKLIMQRGERIGKIINSIEANSIGCMTQILNMLTDRQLEDLDCLWDKRVIKLLGDDYVCEGLVPVGKIKGSKLLKVRKEDMWEKINGDIKNKYGRRSITGNKG